MQEAPTAILIVQHQPEAVVGNIGAIGVVIAANTNALSSVLIADEVTRAPARVSEHAR